MKTKYYLFFVLCFSISGLFTQLFAKTNCKKILNTVIKSVEYYQSPDNAINELNISKTITKFSRLWTEKIGLPKSKDFEQFQKKTKKAAILLIKLANRLETEKDNIHLIVALCDVYFQTLHKVQSRIQEAYDKFGWRDKLRNGIPFVQSRTAINHAKTNLLAMVTASLSKLNKNIDKKHGWEVIDKMTEKINIKITEIGAIKDEFHSIVILTKLSTILETIETIYVEEPDEEIKSFVAQPMEKIWAKQQEFREQLDEAKKKRREFVSQLARAKDYSGEKKKFDYQEIKDALTANEWFQKGYYTDDYHKKMTYFTKAIEIEPTFLPAYINRGVCYDHFDKYEEAIQDYTKALELDSLYTLVYNYRGMSYYSLGRYEEAIRDYDKAIELDALFVLAYINRGECYDHLGRYTQAIQDYSKAIKLDPKNAQIYNLRGISFTNLKKYKQAIQDYTRAIEISPNSASAYYNLGCAYWELKNWNEVIKAWEKSLELEPNQEHLLKHLRLAKEYARLKKRKAN